MSFTRNIRALRAIGGLAAVLAVCVLAAAVFAATGLDSLTGDSCVTCHMEADYLPGDLLEDDIHFQTGLSCAGCHGGDPESDDQETAMSPAAGFVGVPSKRDLSAFCGKCHSDIEFMRRYQPRIPTDQVRQYATSKHGMGLAAGDDKVAACADCHTAHAILPASDSRSSSSQRRAAP